MGARTKARKRALDVLFEADQRGNNATSTLDARILLSGRETPLPPYAIEIVRGVVSRWVEINAIIQDASPAWTIARMPGIDRGLLRIATWEILCNDDVPTSVAINEAVTLATGLSTDESARFINGLLSTIARDAPALSRTSATDVEDYGEVESADGAAIFDSLVADVGNAAASAAAGGSAGASGGTGSAGTTRTTGTAGMTGSQAGAGDADDDLDDSDEREADADFDDAGLSDEVAKEWAERLLADDEATLVPITAADVETAAAASPAEATGANRSGEVEAEVNAADVTAADVPEPTHKQD